MLLETSLQTESAAVFLNDSTSPPQSPFVSQSPALNPPSHTGTHCLRLLEALSQHSITSSHFTRIQIANNYLEIFSKEVNQLSGQYYWKGGLGLGLVRCILCFILSIDCVFSHCLSLSFHFLAWNSFFSPIMISTDDMPWRVIREIFCRANNPMIPRVIYCMNQSCCQEETPTSALTFLGTLCFHAVMPAGEL